MVSDREKIDAYLAFHSQSLKSFYERRGFEWKFNLSFWAPLSLLIGFMMQGQIQNNPFCGKPLLLIGAHIWVFLLYSWWVIHVHNANMVDKRWAYDYKAALERFIHSPNEKLEAVDPPERKVTPKIALRILTDWSPFVQIAITVTLLLLSIFVFWQD